MAVLVNIIKSFISLIFLFSITLSLISPSYSMECDARKATRVKVTSNFSPPYAVYEDAEASSHPKPFFDVLSASEEEQMQFLKTTPYLPNAIYKVREEEDLDYFICDIHRIDPSCFLLPAETVRKWYYTINFTSDRVSPETYESLDKGTLRPFIFNRFFNFPADPKERCVYYRNNPIGFIDQELIGWNLAAARRILRFTTSQDRIIIFGNTPYFVGRAIEFLTTERQKLDALYQPPKLIYLPFSGAPNVKSTRNAFKTVRDKVTADRLAHFQRRLEKLGLCSDNPELLQGTTFIVDVVGAGTGLAFTMETILRDFRQYVSDDRLPDFEVISLNVFREDEPRNMGIASFPAGDGNHLELSFPYKHKPAFIVPAQVIYVKGHGTMDKIPEIHPMMRMVPEYNPWYWSEEFDYLLSAPRTPLQVIIEEHFQENLRALIEKGHAIK